ncbi:MAG: radical SAM protein [Coriobacteriia bacterium]|nr:radical SAM protein [Coriobacteriia bacterium]MBS5478566.1 radical SAM protein [Coriobacteriia bacterium]
MSPAGGGTCGEGTTAGRPDASRGTAGASASSPGAGVDAASTSAGRSGIGAGVASTPAGRPGAEGAGVGAPAAAACPVCPHHCRLRPGQLGRCRARVGGADGQTIPLSYGRATALALDPVEKKPLARWRPGTLVLSVGSYGCNLSCPFCQNAHIAAAGADDVDWRELAPDELVAMACRLRERDGRVTGLAFTYNEPLVSWEYVRDCARLAHARELANVLVSNGCACTEVISELCGLIDAANIDLKAWGQAGYNRLGGDFACVRSTIAALAADPACHLEVTTLVVPGLSDAESDVDAMAAWLAELPYLEDGVSAGDASITYHLTRFFPRHRMADASPTPVATVRHLADVARRHLGHVYVGNC